jgi:hypothetical protein
MGQGNNSVTVTAVLCLVLIAANYWLQSHAIGFPLMLGFWPVGFILCVWIAARFFHGHGKP